MRKAWERTCHDNPLPVDTVLVAGLEDVKARAQAYENPHNSEKMAEDISEAIKEDIEALFKVICDHSKRFEVDDTLAVATLIHVPSMYWLSEDNPHEIDLEPVIDRTNLKIEEFNLKHGRKCAPKLHQICERGKGKQKKNYIWNAFVEEDRVKKFHLSTESKLRVARIVTKYLREGTPRSIQFLP